MRATPKAGRDAIGGIVTGDDGRQWLAVRLAAAPSEGAANDALVRLIAKALGVAKRDVALANGTAARLKRLRITGDPATLGSALDKIIRDRIIRGKA